MFERLIFATRTLLRQVRGRDGFFPYALIAPMAILMIAITFYPTIYAVWLATTDASLLRLSRAKFIGIDNFVRLLSDTTYIESLWRTVRWDIVVVASELLIAMPLALFLNLHFRGRGIIRAAMLVPYVIPPAVTALIWVYIVDGNFGILNEVLVRVGALDHNISWLSDPDGAFATVSSAMIWSGTPLMVIMLLAALQSIPAELYESAAIDGAGPWARFRYVTWPHLRTTVLFLMLIRTIWMSNHIDMIFIMTGGGPGFSNYTEAVYSFMLTTRFQIGYSAAVAVTLAAALMLLSVFYVRHLARKILA